MIPKIIHQTHYDESLDFVVQSKRSIQETNASWDYKFWSNEMAQDLVVNSFPEFSNQWLLLNNKNILKWDIFRLMVIYVDGGLYVDVDTIFQKSIDDILDLSNEFIGALKHNDAHWIKNHFFLGSKGSKFLYDCLEKIFAKLPQLSDTYCVHRTTGGIFLYNQLNLYLQNNILNYQLLKPKFIANNKLKFEGYKNLKKANQRFNWNEVYVLHLLNASWCHAYKYGE